MQFSVSGVNKKLDSATLRIGLRLGPISQSECAALCVREGLNCVAIQTRTDLQKCELMLANSSSGSFNVEDWTILDRTRPCESTPSIQASTTSVSSINTQTLSFLSTSIQAPLNSIQTPELDLLSTTALDSASTITSTMSTITHGESITVLSFPKKIFAGTSTVSIDLTYSTYSVDASIICQLRRVGSTTVEGSYTAIVDRSEQISSITVDLSIKNELNVDTLYQIVLFIAPSATPSYSRRYSGTIVSGITIMPQAFITTFWSEATTEPITTSMSADSSTNISTKQQIQSSSSPSPMESTLLFANTDTSTTSSRASTDTLLLVRPFADYSDIEALLRTFDEWELYRPCTTVETDAPKMNVDIILYYSGSIVEDRYTLPQTIGSPSIKTLIGTFIESYVNYSWTECFGNIKVVGANISKDLDIYNPRNMSDPLWNRGPNEQFNRLFNMKLSTDLVYIMEHDSQPQYPGWLTDLIAEIVKQRPFFILGSVYVGHNWNHFKDQLPKALLHHINGNAIYNLSHPILTNLHQKFSNALVANSSFKRISSYDVWIAEVIIGSKHGDFDFPVESLESHGYKRTTLIDNFAGTIRALPENQSHQASVVHGARNFVNWSDLLNSKSSNAIALVIIDWGLGDGNGDTTVAADEDQQGDVEKVIEKLLDEFETGRLPFLTVKIMTPSHSVASVVKSFNRSNIQPVVLRASHRDAPLGTWYLCDALPLLAEPWVMITSAHHLIASPFKLPTDVDPKTHLARPLIPFIYGHSQFCGEGCHARIRHAKDIWGNITEDGYERDVAELNVVYNRASASAFCETLTTKYKNTVVIPTANSYFAYLESSGEDLNEKYSFYNREELGLIETFVPRDVVASLKNIDHRARREACAQAGTSFACSSDNFSNDEAKSTRTTVTSGNWSFTTSSSTIKATDNSAVSSSIIPSLKVTTADVPTVLALSTTVLTTSAMIGSHLPPGAPQSRQSAPNWIVLSASTCVILVIIAVLVIILKARRHKRSQMFFENRRSKSLSKSPAFSMKWDHEDDRYGDVTPSPTERNAAVHITLNDGKILFQETDADEPALKRANTPFLRDLLTNTKTDVFNKTISQLLFQPLAVKRQSTSTSIVFPNENFAENSLKPQDKNDANIYHLCETSNIVEPTYDMATQQDRVATTSGLVMTGRQGSISIYNGKTAPKMPRTHIGSTMVGNSVTNLSETDIHGSEQATTKELVPLQRRRKRPDRTYFSHSIYPVNEQSTTDSMFEHALSELMRKQVPLIQPPMKWGKMSEQERKLSPMLNFNHEKKLHKLRHKNNVNKKHSQSPSTDHTQLEVNLSKVSGSTKRTTFIQPPMKWGQSYGNGKENTALEHEIQQQVKYVAQRQEFSDLEGQDNSKKKDWVLKKESNFSQNEVGMDHKVAPLIIPDRSLATFHDTTKNILDTSRTSPPRRFTEV